MTQHLSIDLHQHLWPEELVDRLRARSRAPYLRGWTLHTTGEPAYSVNAAHHDPATREVTDHDDGIGLACVSLSSPLGIESLRRPEASLLIDAWHTGARRLPAHFAAWASTHVLDPDLDAVAELLAGPFVGLQLPATELLSPDAWDRAGDVLRVAERAGKPVFIHPGPEKATTLSRRLPDWWAPVVGYTSQLQAAWWGWQAANGRESFPDLRLVFAAGAGLAPVHHERHTARGGTPRPVDPNVYVDTSSYGRQALDALVRVLGIDALARGTDRPYAGVTDPDAGEAATARIRIDNPRRVLGLEEVRRSSRLEVVA